MLSSGMQCYHLGRNVIIWDEMFSSGLMLSSGMRCYHLGGDVIIWDAMLSSGANVIIWDEMLSFRIKCYHLELMLSSG